MDAATRVMLAQEHTIRIGIILDMASVMAGEMLDAHDDNVEALVDALDESRALGESMNPLLSAYEAAKGADDEVEMENLALVLQSRQLMGYAVRFETPVRLNANAGSFTYSWGRRLGCWFYAETLPEIWTMAAAWSESVQKKAEAQNKAATS